MSKLLPILLAVLSILSLAPAQAITYSPPYTFSPNTLIQSAQMNANFSAAANSINNIDDSNVASGAAINPNKLSGTLPFNTYLLATNSIVIGVGTTGDTVPRLELTSNGGLVLGPGGAGAVDIQVIRTAGPTVSIRNPANNADAAFSCGNATVSGTLSLSNTPLTVPNGGTGDATITSGAIVTGNGTSALSTLAGTGAVSLSSGAPTVGTLTVPNGGTGHTTITSGAIVTGNGASALGTLGGTGAVSLSSGAPTVGTLGVGNGGTGDSTLPVNQYVITGTTSTSPLLGVSSGIVGMAGIAATTFATGPIDFPFIQNGISCNPQKAVFSWAPASNTAISLSTFEGPTALVALTAGTNTSGTGANGRIVNAVTTASSGNAAGYKTTFVETQAQQLPVFSCTFILGPTITNTRLWVGLVSADESGTASPTASMAAVGYDTGLGDTHFVFYTANGSSATRFATSLTPVAGHLYQAIVDGSNSAQIAFELFDQTAGTSIGAARAVTLPAAGTALGPQVTVTTLTTSATQLGIGTIRLESF